MADPSLTSTQHQQPKTANDEGDDSTRHWRLADVKDDPIAMGNARRLLADSAQYYDTDRMSDDEVLVTLFGAPDLCICLFKGKWGRARVHESCKPVLDKRVRVLHEDGDKSFLKPDLNTWYYADAFFLKDSEGRYETYKIDGSTCATLYYYHDRFRFRSCVNLLAWAMGKRTPYLVEPNHFSKDPASGRINTGW